MNVGGARSGCNTPKNIPEMIETIAAPAMIFVIVSSVFASIAVPRSYSSPSRAPRRFAFFAEYEQRSRCREPVVGGRLAPFFLVVFIHAIIVVLGRQ